MSAPLGVGPRSQAPFTDRVMAAVAREASPTPTRAVVSAIRSLSPREAFAALGGAWHLGTVRNVRIGRSVRVRSMALVLSAVTILGLSASLAAAGAAQVIEQVGEFGQIQNGQTGPDAPGPGQSIDGQPGANGQDAAQGGEDHQSGPDERGGAQNVDGQSGPDEAGTAGAQADGNGDHGNSGAHSPAGGTNTHGGQGGGQGPADSGNGENGDSGN